MYPLLHTDILASASVLEGCRNSYLRGSLRNPLNLAVPVLVVWILIGVGYMMHLARTNPSALERGKEVYLKDLETEPTDLAHTLL